MSMSIGVYAKQMQEQNHFLFIQCREQCLIASGRIKEALYGIKPLIIWVKWKKISILLKLKHCCLHIKILVIIRV